MSKIVDMTGQRIGNFLIIKRVVDTSYPKTRWLCLCDCGNYFECNGDTLRSNKHPISCPQCAMDEKNKKKVKNLIGMRFGHLQVMGIEKDEDNHYKQLCKCDCGNSILVDSYSLSSKSTLIVNLLSSQFRVFSIPFSVKDIKPKFLSVAKEQYFLSSSFNKLYSSSNNPAPVVCNN